jgi:hypothetical protein
MKKLQLLSLALLVSLLANSAHAHVVPTDANEVNPIETGVLMPGCVGQDALWRVRDAPCINCG